MRKVKPTLKHVKRYTKDFKEYAGNEGYTVMLFMTESVTLVLCSELASYRIADKYKRSKDVSRGYSEVYQSFYFKIDRDQD